jgi:tubulin monoglycylase TTLL3/8
VTDTFRGVYGKIDPKRRVNTFEIYGYDFMFDDDFKVYLIEVNTNPCLELGCPLLARLIPTMVENALRLSIDPLFPPPENWSQKKCVVNDICPENKFELIFDERIDGPYLTELMKEKNNIISNHSILLIIIIVEIDEEELSDNEVDEKDECDMVIP